jgi:hypothetical protein
VGECHGDNMSIRVALIYVLVVIAAFQMQVALSQAQLAPIKESSQNNSTAYESSTGIAGIYGTQGFSLQEIGRVTYTITLKNTGDVRLTNITLVDILPLNITFDYKNDSIKFADGKLVSNCNLSDEGPRKKITLSLGELDPGKSSVKSVKIDAHYSPSARANPKDNTIKLTAKALGQDVKPFESKRATIAAPR